LKFTRKGVPFLMKQFWTLKGEFGKEASVRISTEETPLKRKGKGIFFTYKGHRVGLGAKRKKERHKKNQKRTGIDPFLKGDS